MPNSAIRRWLPFLMAAFAAAGIVYLVRQSLLNAAPEIDLKYLWFAGSMWSDGQNAYGPDFIPLGRAMFPEANAVLGWAYPPNWWPISVALASVEIETATVLWRGSMAALLLVNCVLLWRCLAVVRPSVGLLHLALLVGFAATMQATALTLTLGQTSTLCAFGLSLVTYGLCMRRFAPRAVGLALLLLKPQIGLVCAFALLARRSQWSAVAVAAAISLLMAAPPLVQHGREAVTGLLDNLSAHEHLAIFGPPETTGIRHLLHWLGFGSLGGWITLLGCVLAWLAARLLPTQPAASGGLQLVAVVVATTLIFAPLHSYDMVIVLPLVPLLLMLPGAARLPIMLLTGSLLLMHRSGNVAQAVGLVHTESTFFVASLLESMLALVIAIAVFVGLRELRSSARASGGVAAA